MDHDTWIALQDLRNRIDAIYHRLDGLATWLQTELADDGPDAGTPDEGVDAEGGELPENGSGVTAAESRKAARRMNDEEKADTAQRRIRRRD